MAVKDKRVAVIGSGLVGRAYDYRVAARAAAIALHGPWRSRPAGLRDLVAEGLHELAAQGLVADPQGAAARVRVAKDLADALDGASFVQENTTETVDAKRVIFAELDRLAAPDAILASSTSSIVASLFTEQLKGRHRCLVAHPVNPPHLVPLVELVGAPWTAPETVAAAKAFYEAVGQVPIVVQREIEGFILNRLQAVLLSEAFRLVQSGHHHAAGSRQDAQGRPRAALVVHGARSRPSGSTAAPAGIPDYARLRSEPRAA